MVSFDGTLTKRQRQAFSQLETRDLACPDCSLAETTKQHPNKNNETGSDTRWTSDVATNMPPSRHGNTNMFVWVSPLNFVEVGYGKHKNEVFQYTTTNYQLWKKICPLGFEKARTDRGGEYMSHAFDAWFKENGIEHSKTAPGSSCGVAEVTIRVLKRRTRAFLNWSNAPDMFWDECTNYAKDVGNMVISWSKQHKGKISPYEARYNKPPPIDRLHAWGCLCFYHDDKASTASNSGKRGAFMGLAKNLDDGYRVWTGKSIIHVKKVDCIEEVPYFVLRNPKRASKLPLKDQYCFNPLCKGKDIGEHSPSCEFHPEYWPVEEFQLDEEEDNVEDDGFDEGPRVRTQTQTFDPQGWDLAYKHDQEQANIVTNTAFHIEHTNSVIDTLTDINTHLDKMADNEPAQEQAHILINEVLSAQDDLDKISARLDKNGQLKSELIPNNEKEFENSIDKSLWLKAKVKEMEMLSQLKTFAKVLRSSVPKDRRPISTRWVYDIKRLTTGAIERYKARLVCKGFMQRQGIDYSDKFAPTPDLVSIRMILVYALDMGFDLRLFDVSSAFLNAPVPEDQEIFIEPPPEYNLSKKWVFKLKKFLYGLVQSSREWSLHIAGKFKKHNFTQSNADSCVFIHRNSAGEVDCVNGIHTDDGILAGPRPAVNKTIKMLKSYYKIREVDGRANAYVGIKIDHSDDGQTLELSQEALIDKLLENEGMQHCNPSEIPARETLTEPPNGPMTEEEELFMKKGDKLARYISIIGVLLYLTRCTRPDIAYAVGYLSRHTNKPRKIHWKALMCVLKYLKGTKSFGLRYTKKGKTDNGRVAQSTAYADADWAGNKTDYTSTSGFAILAGCGTAIDWGSWKQTGIARSSTEAEIVALDTTARRVLWARKLEKELDIGHGEPTKIYEDNNGAISWAVNRKRSKLTKHISVKFFAVSDDVEQKHITVPSIASADNPADLFTKPLQRVKFTKFRTQIGVVDLNSKITRT